MTNSLESLWVKIVDSPRLRQISGRESGRRMLNNPVLRDMNTTRWKLSAGLHSRRYPDTFEDVRSYLMFIGHTKSGGSLIGALLDAHPDAILADEVDGLRYIDAGFRREELFYLLLRMSQRELMKGRVTARRLEPYSLLVPGQWQGRYRSIKVVGDSKAGKSTQRIGQDPRILDQLQQVMGDISSRFIHVIRNPFDPISIMMVRGKRSFEDAFSLYFAYCDILSRVYTIVDRSRIYQVRYEDFVCHPEDRLGEICQYLGLEPTQDYLTACREIVYPAPERSRTRIIWQPDWKQAVEDASGRYDFLSGYSFEN